MFDFDSKRQNTDRKQQKLTMLLNWIEGYMLLKDSRFEVEFYVQTDLKFVISMQMLSLLKAEFELLTSEQIF